MNGTGCITDYSEMIGNYSVMIGIQLHSAKSNGHNDLLDDPCLFLDQKVYSRKFTCCSGHTGYTPIFVSMTQSERIFQLLF